MLTSLRTLTRRVATKRCFTSSSAALDELKTANKPKATNIHHFKVYRWDPDQDQDVSIYILIKKLSYFKSCIGIQFKFALPAVHVSSLSEQIVPVPPSNYRNILINNLFLKTIVFRENDIFVNLFFLFTTHKPLKLFHPIISLFVLLFFFFSAILFHLPH